MKCIEDYTNYFVQFKLNYKNNAYKTQYKSTKLKINKMFIFIF